VPPSNPTRVVVADANVLINLMHAGRLDLLGALTAFKFVVPDHVIAEITEPVQRQTLDLGFTRGDLRQESVTDLAELATYVGLWKPPWPLQCELRHFIRLNRFNRIQDRDFNTSPLAFKYTKRQTEKRRGAIPWQCLHIGDQKTLAARANGHTCCELYGHLLSL
jgi:hypothetical protein